MILTGYEILRQIELGNINISPFSDSNINSNSYDVRLGSTIKFYKGTNGDIPRFAGKCAGLINSEHSDGQEHYILLDTDEHQIVLDPHKDNPTEEFTIPEQGCVLLPGIGYLGHTLETVESKIFVPVIDGKSSTGRLFLSIHATAGFGDCGFKGQWTLEISVINPVRVYAGMRIGQLRFHEVRGEIQPYSGKYQDSYGPIASRSYLGE